ncbi:50S ribosomal protein L25 [Roseivivax sp. THAF40]|uniref:50S ribosomal protein L25/general stress protein Ctc n=1 Tax=unclassified Roseivivax TaxID=2639302 RepID=UPI001267D8B5|nr:MULTISPECIES: 50S ribosomal protein L25/general stress protein Ctc [unclassified Roseivivax]QFS83788.1 50S ribosomal protein L25 [Roseivivax sp. THAF197b]QFT47620.1 50S ribosomal protein L25 [Roseivivax sp. THAF40]
MAGEIPDLHALERTGTGKGAARQARRDGMVPGIVFGGDTDPLPINIPYNALIKRLKAGRFKATLFNLKVEGHDDVRVICRDVQRDVVKDLPTHFDLMRLRRTSKIAIFIPVEFTGEEECPGLKAGGVLTVIRPEIELVVTAGDIPEKVVVDLSKLEIGDSVSASDVEFPSGSKPTIDRDFAICSISAPSGLAASDDDEEPETEVIEQNAETVEGETEQGEE